MLDELKEERIVNKVGGRFKLSTLIQKRIVALNTGAKPLVDVSKLDKNDKLAIVLEEILQDKIYLDTSGSVREQGHNPQLLANVSNAHPGMPNASPLPMPSYRPDDE